MFCPRFFMLATPSWSFIAGQTVMGEYKAKGAYPLRWSIGRVHRIGKIVCIIYCKLPVRREKESQAFRIHP